jgi:hypothetical protein
MALKALACAVEARFDQGMVYVFASFDLAITWQQLRSLLLLTGNNKLLKA